jgi:hypothetical protein
VRIHPNAQEQILQNTPVLVDRLDHVWAVASRTAAARGLSDYGVLVVQTKTQQFSVVVTAFSPESAFTQFRCTALNLPLP